MHLVTKSYRDLPAAHRQPGHDGHCRLIHGHNWGFDITFACDLMDKNGFVLDVGKLDTVKRFLVDYFDHTLLLNEDDIMLGQIRAFMQEREDDAPKDWLAKVVVVKNCGMEGLAKFVFDQVSNILTREFSSDWAHRGLHVVEVTCWEDSKNRATYKEQ